MLIQFIWKQTLDSLLLGVNPAQQHNRLEMANRYISVPISEKMAIAEVLSALRLEQRRVMADLKGEDISSRFSSSSPIDFWTNSR